MRKSVGLLSYVFACLLILCMPAMAMYNWDGFPIQRGAADNAASCNGIPSTPSDNL